MIPIDKKLLDLAARITNPAHWMGNGSTQIPVLEFLWGRPFDEKTLRYIAALGPSRIVINHRKLDAMTGRVNVHVDDAGHIMYIVMQVAIPIFNEDEFEDKNWDPDAEIDLGNYRRGQWHAM